MGIETVSEQEAEKADAVVCMRVADLPPIEDMPDFLRALAEKVRARSSIEPCSVCGEDVLVDCVSPRKPPRVCMHCIMAEVEKEGATIQ